MRYIAFATGLAIAMLLAGCIGSTPDPGSTTASPSSSPQSGNEGIAVGEPHSGGGMLVRPAHADNTSQGLQLVGDEDQSGFVWGGQTTFSYVATNVGADATTRGGCYRPYAFTLRDSNGVEHPLHVPMAQCMGFTNDPFAAGQKLDFMTSWNGTYAEGDHLVRAPEGTYQFTATFTAWRGAQSDETAAVTVTMPVSIVAMGQA